MARLQTPKARARTALVLSALVAIPALASGERAEPPVPAPPRDAIAGLALATFEAAGWIPAKPSATTLLEIAAQIVQAQSRAAEAIAPGGGAPDRTTRLDRIDVARSLLFALERADGRPSPREALAIADAMHLASPAAGRVAQDAFPRAALLLDAAQAPLDVPEAILLATTILGGPGGLLPHAAATDAELVLAALRALPGPAPMRSIPDLPALSRPSDALLEVVSRSGAAPSQAERERILALDATPPRVASAITRIAAAHLRVSNAAAVAFEAPVDLGLLAIAREAAAAEILAAAADLACVGLPPLTVADAFSLDLACVDSEHRKNLPLLIDAGGDDRYSNNAGGATGPFLPAATLVDVAGNDRYETSRPGSAGLGGGGYLGAGFLADLAGNDLYNFSVRGYGGLAGGANTGTGFLHDGGGDDVYRVHIGRDGGATGSGAGGSGFLYDAGGNDSYSGTVALEGALHGSAILGSGALLDLAGDDVYDGNIGRGGGANAGANGGTGLASALLLDGGGNDRYLARIGTGGGGANGGATLATAILLDLGEGSDTYDATIDEDGGAHGGGFYGTGILYDGGGSDRYHASALRGGALNGGGNQGSGYLLDRGGDDVYEATLGVDGGANGAATQGAGFLYDAGGDDRYSLVSNDSAAANGAGLYGAGFLYDADGDDTYVARLGDTGPANGAGGDGSGALFDGRGNDTYSGIVPRVGAINGAGLVGIGLLADASGNDRYTGTIGFSGGVNGGSAEGIGILADGDGDDTYRATVTHDGGMNGGAQLGVGALIDRAGTNRFEAITRKGAASHGAASGFAIRLADPYITVPGPSPKYPGGVGILLAGPGDDAYHATGVTAGAGDYHAIGILHDGGGANRYHAGPGSISQGVGRFVGVGILLDRGHRSGFSLEATARGQGVGLQGVGLLLHENENGEASLAADGPVKPIRGDGGGVGLLATTGKRPLAPPQFNVCPAGDPAIAADASHLVCPPSHATDRPILNPLTGAPLDNETQIPTPGRRTQATTSGSLELVRHNAPDGTSLRSRWILHSADDACQPVCALLLGATPGDDPDHSPLPRPRRAPPLRGSA